MALGVLNIIALIYSSFFILSIFTIIFSKGKLLKNNWIISLIFIFIILSSFLSYTSLPSNYIYLKYASIFCSVISIISIFLRKININFTRLFFLISLIITGVIIL